MASTAKDQNPFHPQDPILCRDDFFNRDAGVRSVLVRLRKGQSVSVVGKKKIGKTSFLHYVSDPQVAVRHGFVPHKHLFCYVDCKRLTDLGENDCLAQIGAGVVEPVSNLEASPIFTIEGATCLDAYLWLEQMLSVFDRAGVQPIVQLDDFDWLMSNERLSLRFLDNLRALSEVLDNLAYLTTSRIPLVDLQGEIPYISGSPFFDIFWEYQLPSFGSAEARSFLATRLEAVGVTCEDGVLEFVCGLSRDEPHRLQLAGTCMYEVWCEKGRRPVCDADCGEIEARFNCELQLESGDPA